MMNNWLRWIVLAAAAVASYWLWQASEHPLQFLAAPGVALAAVVGVLWQSRVQATRRWHAALDAYAERTHGHKRRRKPPKASATSMA